MTGFTQHTTEATLRMRVRKRPGRQWRTPVPCQCCGRASVRRGLCRDHVQEWQYLTQRAVLLAGIEDHPCLVQ